MDAPAGGVGSSPPPHSAPASDNEQSANPLTPPGGLTENDQGTKLTNEEADPSIPCKTGDKQKYVHQKASSSQQKVTSATCIPKAGEQIKVDLPSHRINNEIQFMQDHALIGKFLGFWPTEKALQGWIASKWKPKGQVTLQLGPKGFFMAIFHCVEDKSRIFEGGSYFFNSSGLYL